MANEPFEMVQLSSKSTSRRRRGIWPFAVYQKLTLLKGFMVREFASVTLMTQREMHRVAALGNDSSCRQMAKYSVDNLLVSPAQDVRWRRARQSREQDE